MSGWPNVVGVFHKSCPKQRASYLLESTSDKTKTGPRFGCGEVGHHQTTAELAHTYFTELPRKYREKLYEAYKIDFDMFGYDPDIYLNL